jgi:LacI family transcriptional regulator
MDENSNKPLSFADSSAAKAGRAARLIDVARLANVSRATAARALGQYGLVGQETRDKVLAAAKELNYQANEVARSMRSGKTLTIGVVVAAISNSFFNNTILAIMETAAKYGYQILVLNTNDNAELEVEAVRVLREKRVDGLIVVPSSVGDSDHLDAQGPTAVPVVLFDRLIAGKPLAAMTTDDVFGAGEAIRHLVLNGHTRIGMLIAAQTANGFSTERPERVVSTVEERTSGAEMAMHAAGLSFEPELVRFSVNAETIATEAALSILGSPSRPTAILTTNEEMALAAISAARQLGLVIGRDLSLVTIDDTAWLRVFSPPVTVIERPIKVLAQAAVENLIEEIRAATPMRSVKLRPRLIERQSVRNLA